METPASSYKNNVLVIGCGNVGGELLEELKGLNVYGLDPGKKMYPPKDFKEYISFVCVPTNMNDNKSADLSNVIEAVKKSNAKIIVIKSAIPVTTAKYLSQKYNKRIVVSPEYWGNNLHALKKPNFLILGGDKEDCMEVASLYYKVKPSSNFRIIFTDSKTAELAKYMENCFLALKVTFCNEFAEIAKKFNVNYQELRECFIADSRVNPSHTFVYEDKPYYDSHCLNKDVNALIAFAKESAPLMICVEKINRLKKEENI